MKYSYTLPKELKSTINIYKMFTVQDLFFMTAWIGLSAVFYEVGLVHNTLIIPYWIYTVAAGLFLILRSRGNPGKKQFQALWIFIKKDRCVYHPIFVPKERGLQ